MKKFIKGFFYAFAGIQSAFTSEINMKFHFVFMLFVTLAGFFFSISIIEWIAVLFCFALVFSSEIFNTAIEKLVDLVSPEYNNHAGLVKDLAAGAVLVSSLFSAIIGCIIFIPKVIEYIR